MDTVPPWRNAPLPTVAFPEVMFGDLEAAERHCAELVAYCAERKVEQWRILSNCLRACTCAVLRPTEKAIAETRAALDAGSRSGSYWCDSLILSRLAEAALAAGDPASAGAALQEAFAFVEQSGERFWLADLHRVDGDIALKRPEPDRARAEACFLKAIEIARSQEARILELRAAIDLARLRRETGSPNGARALLEPILAQVEGGETTRDVRNARELLAEIG
jgi:predicted ATPase